MNVELSTLTDVQRRAVLHAALGDPHRLAIVDLLVLSDRSPFELGDALGLRSNLLAHHLDTLEQAGVISRHSSRGDGRRRYVQLVPEILDNLLPAPLLRARAVLFVCHHNSARSLLAQALWESASPIPADSAGMHPALAAHAEAVATGARHGLDMSSARPKGYDAIAPSPDVVISVCDQTRETDLPSAPIHLHWSVPDPVAGGDIADFEIAYAELDRRVAAAVRFIRP